MKEQGLISIVIPVYNAAPYLKDTLESVENQTYTDWELIVVDDASADESLAVLLSYKENWELSKKIQSIRVLSLPKNSGPAAARNAGVKEAKGRYLTFLDADDVWAPDKLEKQIKFMAEKECAFSFTGYEYANEYAERNGKVVHVPERITYSEALKNTTISTITVMFDTIKIEKELLMMPELCQREDTATWWRLLRNGYTAYGLDEALSVYRRHEGSHSSNKLKAVYGTWKLYRDFEHLSLLKSCWYFGWNIWNAVRRRL